MNRFCIVSMNIDPELVLGVDKTIIMTSVLILVITLIVLNIESLKLMTILEEVSFLDLRLRSLLSDCYG